MSDIDIAAQEAITSEAIEQAFDGSPEQWRELAFEAVHQLALTRSSFTADAVWNLIGSPPEPRALGGVMRRAVGAEWIASTEDFSKSTRVDRHRAPLRIWRSLIVRG